MGWWKINSVETGGIDWDGSTLANKIPGQDTPDGLYNGDEPADIMGEALHEISKVYQKAWGRPAKEEELTACFNFCKNGMLPKGG